MTTPIHHRQPVLRTRTILSARHLLIGSLIVISVGLGLALPWLPDIGQYMMIALVPAAIICFLILRNPFLGVFMFYLYTFLRPYDFIPALQPLRLTFVIEILTVLSWVFWLMISKTKIKWDTFGWLYAVFVAVIGITVITARNNFYAYETFMAMIVYFVIFIVATNVVDSIGRLNKLIWLLLLIHIYFAVKGTYTFASGSFIDAVGQNTSGIVGRGFIGDENDFALVMNIMIPFAYFGMLYLKGTARVVSGLLAAGFVLAVVSSFSRGGLVGLASVIMFCILVSNRKLISTMIFVALVGLMVLFAPSRYWEEAETIQNVDEGTANARIQYWTAAGRMFLDHPIIGVGADNGGIYLPQYIRGVRDPDTQWGRAFHGTMPQVLAELGSIGIFCYLAMIYIALKQLFRIRNKKVGEGGDTRPAYLATSIAGSIIAYVATSAFLSTAYYPYLWTLYTLAMILVFVVGTETKKAENPTSAPA